MVRVKRGVAAHKRRKHLLKYTKGFRWGGKSKFAAAKERLLHAWRYSTRDRKAKKRTSRRLWQIQVNAATREHGLSYSRFIHVLKLKQIELDRKVLADLAQNHPAIFNEIVAKVKE